MLISLHTVLSHIFFKEKNKPKKTTSHQIFTSIFLLGENYLHESNIKNVCINREIKVIRCYRI